ncbi:MAG: DUF3604 domain-containing protein [Gammaproteobacteria bacterium]|nr:DUF3604 domain-containing protein [Gammaproteobacteria bacterium]
MNSTSQSRVIRTAAAGLLAIAMVSVAHARQGDDSVPRNPLRNAYFGDLHLHTIHSYDAAWAGARTTPRDAYRYAQGFPVVYMGQTVQRKAPLDFLAVADHSEYMAVAMEILQPDGPFSQTDWPPQMLAEGLPGFRKLLTSGFYGNEYYPELNTEALKRSNWQDVIDVANEFNQPGRFTTFAAYEWSNTPGGAHFHRVVVFPGPKYPEVPFSALDSRHPEDLWRYADNNRANGIDSVLIPHNTNLSNGLHFSYNDSYGNPITREFAEQKARNEVLVEMTQIKGTSETHPMLSPDDEFAGFEIIEHWNGQQPGEIHGSYAREGYARGMEIAERVGANPYQYGMIGSSDYHSSTSATEEDNHTGALGEGDFPFGENIERVLTATNPVLRAPIAALSASGVAGVWAEQNTREAIFAAFQRREVFATSGPRIRVRLFAGDYPQGLVERGGWLSTAYAQGVAMGGEIAPRAAGAESPGFIVHALKDPDGANLDRIQIIKVWRENGASREQVVDVAWSGARTRDPSTGKVPAVGDSVDLTTATYTNDIGAAELAGEWRDPEFNASARAVYYARVIEIPTPRWPTYLAVRNNMPVPGSVPATHQERAWTSPVFYNP